MRDPSGFIIPVISIRTYLSLRPTATHRFDFIKALIPSTYPPFPNVRPTATIVPVSANVMVQAIATAPTIATVSSIAAIATVLSIPTIPPVAVITPVSPLVDRTTVLNEH